MKQHFDFAEKLAELLDNKFQIGKFRFGLDPILGFIPGVGDFIGIALSFYLIWIGAKSGLHKFHLMRMVGNVLLDTVIGAIPVVGDFFDFGFKANIRNMNILRKHFKKMKAEEGRVVS